MVCRDFQILDNWFSTKSVSRFQNETYDPCVSTVLTFKQFNFRKICSDFETCFETSVDKYSSNRCSKSSTVINTLLQTIDAKSK